MARQTLRIRDLGQSTFWQLMQMEGQPAPLTGKTALLLAADGADTQDVLAATAAARQLGMDVDMLPPALWAQDMASCDLQAPLYAHAGLCLTAGLKGGALERWSMRATTRARRARPWPTLPCWPPGTGTGRACASPGWAVPSAVWPAI